MIRIKKWIALGLSAVMVASALLTGCGGNNNGSKDTNAPAGTDAPAETSAPEGTGDATAESSAEAGSVSLPLTEEKETLTVWMKNDVALLNACGGDMNNAPFYKELEERTNVHIEWIIPASGSEQEQLNLMFTSGELADIIFISPGSVDYNDGFDAAIDDGYFLDLTDLLPEYAPNYMRAIENSDPDTQKAVKTDAGRYAFMASLMTEVQPPYSGFVVRQDWLDDLGLETPVTYEDWENMLTKFKEEKGATAPLTLTPYNVLSLGAGLGAYDSFYQIDGTVHHSLIDNVEGMREYLTMMNRWYNNGLIDPDFASETSASYWGNSVLITNNATGCFMTIYSIPSSMYLPSMEEGADFAPVLTPVKTAGDKLNYRASTLTLSAMYAISADCKNPELAVRWIDYMFSDEGILLGNYGIEGETYTLDENGNPVYTDLVLNNPDGLDFNACLRIYTLAPGMPAGYIDYKRELQVVPEKDAAMMDYWAAVTEDYVYPTNLRMSAEENTEYSNIYADISTYISENILSFVTGAKSMDEFDAFVETVQGMGLDRCVELKQGALDRYNAR